jgi:small GTP-binding protein
LVKKYSVHFLSIKIRKFTCKKENKKRKMEDFRFKHLILGDSTVGKTSLTIKYISGAFLEDLRLTIGVDFYNKTFNYNDKRVRLQIWDFAGEQRFRFLLPKYCKGANSAFFLYDITKPITLEHLPEWISIIRKSEGDIPIVLIGSKLDLREDRKVSREEGEKAASKYNLASYIELSSKTGENVEKAFKLMTKILLERYKPYKEEHG